MYRRVWVPDGRAEPFFPLCPRRPCWTISPGVAAGLPPARFAAFGPNDITFLHRHPPYCDRASSAATTTSLPVLRIAARIVVSVYLDVILAALRSLGFGSPGAIQQLHAGELDQRKAAPNPLIAARQWSALSFSPVLITEHSPLAWLVVTNHMRTKESTRAVIPSRNRPVYSSRRNHEAPNLLWRLFGSRARSTHFHSGYSRAADFEN